MVESISTNSAFLPRNRSRAKPYAAMALERVVPVTPRTAITSVLRVQSRKFAFSMAENIGVIVPLSRVGPERRRDAVVRLERLQAGRKHPEEWKQGRGANDDQQHVCEKKLSFARLLAATNHTASRLGMFRMRPRRTEWDCRCRV